MRSKKKLHYSDRIYHHVQDLHTILCIKKLNRTTPTLGSQESPLLYNIHHHATVNNHKNCIF
jgi:hypothetical protein